MRKRSTTGYRTDLKTSRTWERIGAATADTFSPWAVRTRNVLVSDCMLPLWIVLLLTRRKNVVYHVMPNALI